MFTLLYCSLISLIQNALYDLFSGTATEEWGIYPEWSELETANFEKGFLLHGKKFHLIQLLVFLLVE
jgi:hypothetical protein